MRFIYISLAIGLFVSFNGARAQSGLDLANKMIDRAKSLKTIQVTVDAKERILGTYYVEKNNFKININPFKAYFKQEFPQKGLEGLLVLGENGDKAKISLNSFPWLTLNLEPEAEMMMKNHHHAVFHAGFNYVAEVLDVLLKKYQGKSDQLIVSKGLGSYQGQEVWILECNNPFYKIQQITLQKPETIYNIGLRLHINYLSILEENLGSKAFEVLPAGKTLKIPSDYASKMLIYLHKTQYYPVYIKVSDPRGLFEEYKFTNVIINPVYKPDVFSPLNKDYNF